MTSYKFVFAVGLANLALPFLGVPFVFRQYATVAIAVVTIMYALYQRTIAKEREAGLLKPEPRQDEPVIIAKTIEEVVEMKTPAPVRRKAVAVSDVKPQRKPRKPKVAVQEETYE